MRFGMRAGPNITNFETSGLKKGRFLMDNDKKTFIREGIEPIKRVFTDVLYSVAHRLTKWFKIAGCYT